MNTLPSIGDISGLGKPASKLIDAVSAACGKIYEPTHIRRLASARADEMLTLANADVAKREIMERAATRFIHEAVREQENLDAIVEGAVNALPESVSERAVDVDWTTMFTGMAKSISSKKLQEVWSELLAQEVAEPGTVSRRTMAIVQGMNAADATLFSRVAGRVFQTKEMAFLIRPATYSVNDEFEVMEYGIDYDGFTELASYGLFVTTSTEIRLGAEPLPVMQGNDAFTLRAPFADRLISIPIWALTAAGTELVSALHVKSEPDHRNVAFKHLEHEDVFILCEDG